MSESVVTFRVGGVWLAASVSAIAEIADEASAAPIPRAPPHVLGLVNLRGQALPVIDLVRLLDIPGEDEHDEQAFRRIVVVQADEMRVGFEAEQVLGVSEVFELEPVLLNQGRGLADVARGEFMAGPGVVTVLDVGKLLQRARIG